FSVFVMVSRDAVTNSFLEPSLLLGVQFADAADFLDVVADPALQLGQGNHGFDAGFRARGRPAWARVLVGKHFDAIFDLVAFLESDLVALVVEDARRFEIESAAAQRSAQQIWMERRHGMEKDLLARAGPRG